MIREEIISALKKVLDELGIEGVEPIVEVPGDPSHGDYATNVAMVAYARGKAMPAGRQGKGERMKWKNSLELAEEIAKPFILDPKPYLDRIEVVSPGFINFWLSKSYLVNQLEEVLKEKEKFGQTTLLDGKKIMVEYAHPNTHKLFHIGHLRNISLGETICRLLEYQKAKVIRANYQGDVGLHIAKALWGIKNLGFKKPKTLDEKVKFLAQAYVVGNKAYEQDEKNRREIEGLNKKLYEGDRELMGLWKKTRSWSLDYFDKIYKRVYTKFDRLYFESKVADPGKKLILDNLNKVFVKDQGAIIFPGEKYGLHNRVFINKIGLPTYEGKDIGLAKLQLEEFLPDRIIHVVGPEQKGYFEVVFRALEELSPEFHGKEYHLLYGFVRLKEGKMSSRTGEVIEGGWLLDEAKSRIRKKFPEIIEEIAEKVAVGAVKYSMLKFSTSSDISFSFEESISLEGNSGSYLQYTYARTRSVVRKSQISFARGPLLKLEDEELSVLRMIVRFSEVVEEAAGQMSPNLLCNYLFDLAQKFNLFYQKHPILEGGEKKDFRLALTRAVGQVLQTGLYLLGIQSPAKM